MVEFPAESQEPEQGQDLPSPPPPAGDDQRADPTGERHQDPEPEPAPAPELEPEPDPQPANESEPEPEPQTEPEPQPELQPAAIVDPPADPAVASTLFIPATGEAEPSEGGGEWELLSGKLRDWLSGADVQQLMQRYSGPLKLLAGFVALVLLLRIYAALLGAIDSLPLVPGLLELAGVIWLGRFALTHLVRSSDRQMLLTSWQQRWAAFRGQP